ncbi:Diaminopimelate decarboxylase [Serratia ficaria]|uniref:diaminopimelate decarboxylase family protein n=1 Tax=Serratia ficaria TaxID=61651 RepID=UPI0021826F1D|nr:diaminopimelate decarboxylase [Serratia ficaria]CAI2534966.1 Diaminopimelate decarboxylase [Serratia ficaria]
MPMSKDYHQRLMPKLKDIALEFGTPFHIYDEIGIREVCRQFKTISDKIPFKQYFAVKALPNPYILEILFDEGMGFDCASIPEIELASLVGAHGHDIFFTSNNTRQDEFEAAFRAAAIVNLDDACFLDTIYPFPELACFRMAAGSLDQKCTFMGATENSKFGVPYSELVETFLRAKSLGANRFGFHAMLCSNQRSAEMVLNTAELVVNHALQIAKSADINFEFVNIGGCIGIPYRPEEDSFNFPVFANGLAELHNRYFDDNTRIYTECGRYVTGPHGVLVTTVNNIMSKFRTFIGIDAGMSALMRPAIYPDAYHHITLPFVNRTPIIADIVGSLCENNDKFAIARSISEPQHGDLMLIHDTGAHGAAMGFNYNGRLRPKELMLRQDGSVMLIREAETTRHYFSTIPHIDMFPH